MQNSLKSSISDQKKLSQCRSGTDWQRCCSISLLISCSKEGCIDFSGCSMAWRQQPEQRFTSYSRPVLPGWWGCWKATQLELLWNAGCMQCWIFFHWFWWDSNYFLAISSGSGLPVNKLPDVFSWTLNRVQKLKKSHREIATCNVYPVCRKLFSPQHFPSSRFWSFFMFPHYLLIFTSQNRYPMINMCRKLSPWKLHD